MKLLKFKERPAHTLLFVADTKSYRMDVDRKAVALSEVQEIDAGCANAAKLAACIEAVAAAGGALGRKTWILCARLPMHLLTLPAMQVAGVKEDVLLQALQFELEGMTGQAAAGRPLAYRLLNSEDELNQYWLAHIDALAFDDLLQALRKAGSKLGGLLHPGGLPAFIAGPEQAGWLRIEAWPEQILAVSRQNGETGMSLFDFDSRNWQASLENWLRHASPDAASETLLNSRIEVLPETQRIFNLTAVDEVGLWLSLWAQTLLTKKTPPVPLLKQPPLFDHELALRIASGAVVVVLCLAHLLWNLRQTNHYQTEAETLKQAEKDMQALRKQISDQNGEKDKLHEKLAKLQGDVGAIPKTLTVLQQRPAKLLEALAKGRPADLVVEELASDKDAVTVKGVALQAGLANQLSAALETQLSGMNWQVAAPAKEDMGLFQGGGPWTFSVALQDKGLASAGKQEKAKP